MSHRNLTHLHATRRGSWALGAALAAAVALALAPAASAKPETVGGGTTTLKMKKAVAEFLADTGTKVKAIDPAKDRKSGIQFPIAKGELDPKKVRGTLKHDGGLDLRGDGGKAELTRLQAKFGKGSKLKAKVDGKNTALFELDTENAKAKEKSGTLTYSKIKAIATTKGVTLIEEITDMELEDRELVFGKLKVKAEAGGGELPIGGGDAGLALDPAARQKFDSQGITRNAVSPATRQGDEFTFPVLGGKVAEDGSSGDVRLDGGIRLTKAGTNLELTKPRIHLGDGEITAIVDGQRRTVMSFNANRAEVSVNGDRVRVSGVAAKLTEDGATAINDAFGGTAFSEGDAFGAFEVEATGS
ncbi:MAG: HtaA domain-containing protein [Solirubrobacterales bacterium]